MQAREGSRLAGPAVGAATTLAAAAALRLTPIAPAAPIFGYRLIGLAAVAGASIGVAAIRARAAVFFATFGVFFVFFHDWIISRLLCPEGRYSA